MKKKIALLLALSTLLSILPLNTFAQQGWTWNRRTGSIWEAAGAATNIRHWDPGVLIGREAEVNAVANHPNNVDNQGRRFITAAGGNLRHIVVGSDYFFNHPGIPMTSIRMQIHNVESWLGRLSGGPAETFNHPAGTFTNMNDWLTNAFGAPATLTTTQAALRAQMDGIFFNPNGSAREIAFTHWESHTATTSFGVMVVLESNRVAHVVLLREGTNWETFADPSIFIPIPIEYVTNSYTNDYPVYLTFQERSGFPQAGEANRRTPLTANQPSRFRFSLDGTPRAFHRYGRVELQPLRIAEAVQGAFDQRNWFVELNITTPGFFWTAASLENMGFTTRFQESATSIGRPVLLSRIQRYPERGNNRFRSLNFAIDLPGAMQPNRLVNDWIDITGLSISADDRARVGDVEVEVVLRRTAQQTNQTGGSWWSWSWTPVINPADGLPAVTVLPDQFIPNVNAAQGIQQRVYRTAAGTLTTAPATTAGVANTHVGTFNSFLNRPVGGAGNWVAGDRVYDGTVTVARFGRIGLELEVHEDDDVDDFWLRSGMREWNFDMTEHGVGRRPIGAVNPSSVNPDYHRTARVVLRETVPGSLPATGAHPTTFSFNEGIQVLGVRMWTNNANFSAGHNDTDDEIWFGDVRYEADNFLSASISRNTVTIRPEIGESITRRNRVAEITAEFYLSVQPEYEGLYGEDIDVTVTSGTIETPFEESVTIAYAWDPITVETTPIVLDETVEAAFGLVRNVPVSDVVITEVEAGALLPGTRLWLGVEGGISRGWGVADVISIGAGEVRVEGDTQMQVSRPRLDSHGVYVEIIRGSRYDGAQIIFSDVEISGRVIPNHEYAIIVADNAVADNWNEFVWIREELGFNANRGTVHGFFTQEPYTRPAFSFEGADIFGPQPQPEPPPVITVPRMVTLYEGMSHRTADGTMLTAPLFLLVPNMENQDYSTSYVMMRVVADVLGLEWYWDPEARSASFTDGTTEVVFSHGSSTALVNGVPTEIRASGLRADARIINDRFFVPIAFFRYIFNANVNWNGAARSVTVATR